MAIKENVLRKNLITNQIDRGQVDTEFEQENLNGNIIEEYPWIEITEDDKDYVALLLERTKLIRFNEVEIKRKELQYANITYNSIPLFATEKARDNLFMAAIISKDLGITSLNWLDVNNNPVTLTLDDANTIIAMLMQRDNALYLKEAQLKLAIDACASLEDILDKEGKVISQGVNSIQIQF